jgi:hypothetical protein
LLSPQVGRSTPSARLTTGSTSSSERHRTGLMASRRGPHRSVRGRGAKVTYRTHAQAVEAARVRTLEWESHIQPYKCLTCPGWHIGHAKPPHRFARFPEMEIELGSRAWGVMTAENRGSSARRVATIAVHANGAERLRARMAANLMP